MKIFTLIDKAFLLKRTPIFAALDLDLLLAIADKLSMVDFDAGETIFSSDQEGHRMYIVAKGNVVLRDRHHTATLTVGDFFGDEALFSDKMRVYEAISQTDAILLSLSRTHLMAIISECPPVAIGFLQEYAAALPWRGGKK